MRRLGIFPACRHIAQGTLEKGASMSDWVACAHLMERRRADRHRGNAKIRIVRSTDVMRSGIAGEIDNVSCHGFSCLLPVCLRVGEEASIEVQNHLHRITVKRPVQVIRVERVPGGLFLHGCTLQHGFNPRELLALHARSQVSECVCRPFQP